MMTTEQQKSLKQWGRDLSEATQYAAFDLDSNQVQESRDALIASIENVAVNMFTLNMKNGSPAFTKEMQADTAFKALANQMEMTAKALVNTVSDQDDLPPAISGALTAVAQVLGPVRAKNYWNSIAQEHPAVAALAADQTQQWKTGNVMQNSGDSWRMSFASSAKERLGKLFKPAKSLIQRASVHAEPPLMSDAALMGEPVKKAEGQEPKEPHTTTENALWDEPVVIGSAVPEGAKVLSDLDQRAGEWRGQAYKQPQWMQNIQNRIEEFAASVAERTASAKQSVADNIDQKRTAIAQFPGKVGALVKLAKDDLSERWDNNKVEIKANIGDKIDRVAQKMPSPDAARNSGQELEKNIAKWGAIAGGIVVGLSMMPVAGVICAVVGGLASQVGFKSIAEKNSDLIREGLAKMAPGLTNIATRLGARRQTQVADTADPADPSIGPAVPGV